MLLEGATRVSSRTSQAYSVVVMNPSRKRLGTAGANLAMTTNSAWCFRWSALFV